MQTDSFLYFIVISTYYIDYNAFSKVLNVMF